MGSLMGILRTTPVKAFVWIGNAWTELFRNIPLLVQIFLWYHVIPSIFGGRCRRVPDFIAVVIALGLLHVGAHRRAGQGRHPGAAARASATPASRWASRCRRRTGTSILPMAFRIVIPPLTSESMNIIKNSSVAFAVSISELTFFAMQAQEETSRGVEIYLAVTVPVFHLGVRGQPRGGVHREARAGSRA